MDIVNEDDLGSDHIVNYVSMSGKVRFVNKDRNATIASATFD